jgi:tripeptidyl-peptidase-1
LDFLMLVSTTDAVPWVISTSYGDDEPTVNYNYAVRMNVEFQKAGVRGISMLFSSGDGGVSGGQSQQCTTFIPTFPAGSPWVTSVGGTTQFDPEVGVSFSSGGFANYWAPESYQTAAIQAYLTKYATDLPPSNLYNATGRGFPDVSAQGTNYPVYQGGFAMPVDGTSCSTPTFSAIVALLNDVRFAAGKSSLGFLNPMFYQNAGMFSDITSGSNPGCGTNGFTASTAWDPITGLGTPNFEKMAQVVKNLP